METITLGPGKGGRGVRRTLTAPKARGWTAARTHRINVYGQGGGPNIKESYEGQRAETTSERKGEEWV